MYKQSYDEVLEEIISVDPRYQRDAYHFVREGLDYTQQSISKQEKGVVRHISGQELLGGMREHALEQYGPMTLLVLDEWGVKSCEDFGEIVFNMVEHNLLAKTSEDSREDFKEGYDFKDAFRKPFLPAQTPQQSNDSAQRNHTPVSRSDPDRSGKTSKPESSDKQ
tara:strand:+ start:107 stop:601 length:495 start_codon:yes stop_codon:yes gene_type:complete